MQKFFNEGLGKEYEGYLIDGVRYFTKEVAEEIAKDITDDSVDMHYNAKLDAFVYIDSNFMGGYFVKYPGCDSVDRIDGSVIHVYPIGRNWTLWND